MARKYFSTVAKTLHSLRDSQRKMPRLLGDKFGAEGLVLAKKVFSTRVPIAMSGRWGATARGERFLLQVRRDGTAESVMERRMFTEAAELAWQPKGSAAGGGPATALPAIAAELDLDAVDGTAELAIESMQAETIKKGRYRKDALACLRDDIFIDSLILMLNKSREPLEHFKNWLQQRVEYEDIDGETRLPGKVALLVWWKAQKLLEDFEDLTKLENWSCFLQRMRNDMERLAMSECILMMTLQHHADFSRRIVDMVENLPYKLLVLAYRGRDVECNRRRELCVLLTSVADDQMHMIAVKLKKAFPA